MHQPKATKFPAAYLRRRWPTEKQFRFLGLSSVVLNLKKGLSPQSLNCFC